MQGGNGWRGKVAARFGATTFGRSPETWRRRDSILLVFLLLVVDYFLVAIFFVVDMNTLGSIVFAAGTVPILAYTAAEAVQGIRPTAANLRRADRLAVLAVGMAVAIVLIVALEGLITGTYDD